jgi:hypothetical protein
MPAPIAGDPADSCAITVPIGTQGSGGSPRVLGPAASLLAIAAGTCGFAVFPGQPAGTVTVSLSQAAGSAAVTLRICQ